MLVTQKLLLIFFSNIGKSIAPIVKGVNILPLLFQYFSLSDLQRLKNDDKWLTDSHVTFGLLYVPIFCFVIDLNKLSLMFLGTVINIVLKIIFGGT